MLSLVLLRGLPGAGKTTLAGILSEGRYSAFSIDDYFTDKETGAYRFEFDKNHLAYKYCEEAVREAMIKQEQKIFVHNTFTADWEMEPYFKLAREFKYVIYVLTVENRHGSKNSHNISDEQVQKMAEKYKVVMY